MSYGINEPLHFGQLGDPAPAFGTGPTTLAQLQNPASTMVLADAVWPTTGSAYNGNPSDWTRTPDPNNPNDPAHYCLIHRVSYPNDPALAFDYVPPDFPSCNSAPPQFDAYARHSNGDNIGCADGHSKWRRDSAITNDLYAGTFVNGSG
ncbi:MAG TPA: hypothetical protein VGS41_10490, partial [Chthonomonadales bacterium]|nr:hypothetical protein [Chthonomonadales bacterium]